MTTTAPCLLALVLSLGAPADDVDVTVLLDAWPARPRVTGYEYNQKNHQATPEFVGGDERRSPGISLALRRRFRIVGIRIDNRSAEELEVDIRSPQIRGNERLSLTVPARDRATRHFVIREPADRRLQVQVFPDGERTAIASSDVELPEDGRVSGWAAEALAIAKELDREDRARRELRTRPLAIELADDLGKPVPDARLVLLLSGGMMVYEGRTDAAGRWSGRVLPGAYEVYAIGEVPDRTDRSSSTIVEEPARLLALRGRIGAGELEVRLAPERVIRSSIADVDDRPLSPRRLWITPEPLARAYRYELVAGRLGSRARLDSTRPVNGGRFLLLTSSDLALDVATLIEPRDGLSVFLRARLPRTDEELALRFDPGRCGRIVVDPTTGAGPGQAAKVELVAVGGLRESWSIDAEALHTCYVAPDDYRVGLRYRLHDGDVVSFLPYRVACAPGKLVDLTPRAPFDLTLYFKRKDKKLQFWLAVSDAFGRLLTRAPRGGRLVADGRHGFEQSLASLRWEAPVGMEHANLEKLRYRAELPFGVEPIEATPRVERLRVFNVEGASGTAPGILEPRMLAFLPEVKRAIDGCLRFLGLPEGLRRIHMEFDIFLPPGVGGLGGGGTITLDTEQLFPITHGSDLLPGAFRHELGHNLGFGHDPYMLLAPAGVDEERFGSFGYRMLHADDFQATLGYLEGDRQREMTPWSPGASVYDALRLLHGPEIHKRMFQERKASEQTLRLHDLSSIERIATLYSLAVGRNLAWIFRAHGWPVFDQRVDLGGSAVRFARKHPRQLDYQKVDGTAVASWWVFGPVSGFAGDDGDPPSWRAVQWPSSFVALDEDRAPTSRSQRYLLYRKLMLPRATEATLLCAADVQLEVRLNGAAVGFLDASPQYAQPVHDELMLNQKRAFTVHLYKGENHLEVAVNQPKGAKGFLLELVTADGKPLPLALSEDGPLGETLDEEVTRLPVRDPVYNGSFENGPGIPTAWTVGANEGGLKISSDVARRARGERSLRFDLPGATRGGLIQRVVVTPGKKYRLSAALRTEGFDGEAYVSLFTGDLNGAVAKTAPLRKASSDWKVYEASWFPGFGRVIYVACYVRGSAGTVWFDEVSLKETR